MKKVQLVSLFLALALALTPLGALAEFNDHTAYSQYPLVKEGEKLKISVSVLRNDTYGIDAEDMWFWKWAQQASGIDFEIEQIGQSAMNERKSLMMASADLPDFLMGLTITPDELVRYGQSEGLFMDLTPYINEEITPHLCAWLAEYPEAKALCTTPDGKMYTLPGFSDFYIVSGNLPSLRYHTAEVAETGLGEPKTLDEFIQLMYALKEKYPDSIPLGGSAQYADPRDFILNALGYLSDKDPIGSAVALKDGQVVIPAYDEGFLEALKIFNDFYAKGIISRDFFTMDQTNTLSEVAKLKQLSISVSPYAANSELAFFQSWSTFSPLTSQSNPVAQVFDSSNNIRVGYFEIAADCDPAKAETIMRFIDFFYSDLGGMYLWCGPAYNSADTLGIVGGYQMIDGLAVYVDVPAGKYANNSAYLYAASFGLAHGLGNRSHPLNKEVFDLGVHTRPEMRCYFSGVDIVKYEYKPEQASGFDLGQVNEKVAPYLVNAYPAIVYYTEDEVQTIADLKSVIDPYIETEVAKFITGARSLDEFDAFRKELENIGIQEYLKIFQDYYAGYVALDQ